MKIEIDQSGKIEQTSQNTIVALSNGVKCAIFLSKQNKRLLQKYARSKASYRQFPYIVFGYLIARILILLPTPIISFTHIGKLSSAHEHASQVGAGKIKPDEICSSDEVIEFLANKKVREPYNRSRSA